MVRGKTRILKLNAISSVERRNRNTVSEKDVETPIMVHAINTS